MVQHPKTHKPELYSQALSIIVSLETSPSCNRLATATLLDSCQSLEHSTKAEDSRGQLESELDQVKSVYAARLAVCELTGAHANSPYECSALMPTENLKWRDRVKTFLTRDGQSKGRSGHVLTDDRLTHKQLGQCLRSLETRPQWWTSYSNARQNAVVMCRAVRTDIDRGA